MDVIVTIPKRRLAEVAAEEEQVKKWLAEGENGVVYWWALARPPRKLEDGDRCYFVWDGAIRAWHEVLYVEEDYDGRAKLILDPVIHSIEPVPMKGFRGFRYTERI
jgi:hypothetical protein